MKYIKINVEDKFKNKIFISWVLTKKCNYSCWYCYQDSNIKYNEIDYKYGIEFIKKIIKKYPNKEILVDILGGEVLHYKKINNLLIKLKNLNVKIDITTNGSKPSEWWSKYRNLFDNITLSYHHKQVNQDKFFETCKIITTTNPNKYINIALMMDPKYFDEIYKYAIYLTKNIDNLIINTKAIRGKDEIQIKYISKQRDILINNNKIKSNKISKNSNPFGQSNLIMYDEFNKKIIQPINTFILKQEHKFKGWYCNYGIDSFYIECNGDVFGANCSQNKNLGNIMNLVKLDNKPIICKNEFCNCRTDLYLTKWRNNDK